jgi:NAD(P)-dependent dehydrogenase (short-subunit alcohol dehydrogenase family)
VRWTAADIPEPRANSAPTQQRLAYSQSKLASLLFAFELQRRASDTPLLSLAAHPGYSATNLQFAGPAHSYERAAMSLTKQAPVGGF